MTTRPLKAFRDQAAASLARGLRQLGIKEVGATLEALALAPEHLSSYELGVGSISSLNSARPGTPSR